MDPRAMELAMEQMVRTNFSSNSSWLVPVHDMPPVRMILSAWDFII